VTMVFGGIACLLLIACLQMVQSRNLFSMRSLAWNSAIPVLESGIEEAFTHLKVDVNLTTNGWTQLSAGVYQKRRNFPDSNYCIVTISNASSVPIITSQGF